MNFNISLILDINECPPLSNQLQTRQNDPTFNRYLQQSNARCDYAYRHVCCPGLSPQQATRAPPTTVPSPTTSKSPGTTKTPSSTTTSAPATTTASGVAGGKTHGWPAGNPNDYPVKLLTPEEGCGFSNETLNRIVGGVPAKLGQWP